jgi:hypothetical protein
LWILCLKHRMTQQDRLFTESCQEVRANFDIDNNLESWQNFLFFFKKIEKFLFWNKVLLVTQRYSNREDQLSKKDDILKNCFSFDIFTFWIRLQRQIRSGESDRFGGFYNIQICSKRPRTGVNFTKPVSKVLLTIKS